MKGWTGIFLRGSHKNYRCVGNRDVSIINERMKLYVSPIRFHARNIWIRKTIFFLAIHSCFAVPFICVYRITRTPHNCIPLGLCTRSPEPFWLVFCHETCFISVRTVQVFPSPLHTTTLFYIYLPRHKVS